MRSAFSRLRRLCVDHPACQVLSQLEQLVEASQWTSRASFHSSRSAAAATSQDSSAAEIFDRSLKAVHRNRAAYLRHSKGEDPLLAEISERLLDRLEDCKRIFPVAAVLGGAGESVLSRLRNGRAGVEEVHYLDSSPAMLNRAEQMHQASASQGISWPKMQTAIADEEFLPLRPGSMDVIISCLGLHWVNDVPGAMAQCRRALKPDGLFLAAMWGGNTLQELRIACMMAEEASEGGVSQRVSPLAQVRDAGNLLTRAGLNIPSVDVDEVTVHYNDPNDLVQHLRLMGESNAVRIRQPRFRRQTWDAARAAYLSTLTDEERKSGTVPATYEAIYMTGWAPHKRQQQPMSRGSATASFQDLEKALRQPSG